VGEKGKKLRIEYESPDLSLVYITDGSRMWTYVPQERAYTMVEASTDVDDGDEKFC
jgi:outer membrane lipoprotein-sorting protein